MIITRNPSIYSKKINDKWIILEPNKEYTRELNNVASFIWETIKDPIDEVDLINKICQAYSVKKTQASKDLNIFLSEFIKEKFIINK